MRVYIYPNIQFTFISYIIPDRLNYNNGTFHFEAKHTHTSAEIIRMITIFSFMEVFHCAKTSHCPRNSYFFTLLLLFFR